MVPPELNVSSGLIQTGYGNDRLTFSPISGSSGYWVWCKFHTCDWALVLPGLPVLYSPLACTIADAQRVCLMWFYFVWLLLIGLPRVVSESSWSLLNPSHLHLTECFALRRMLWDLFETTSCSSETMLLVSKNELPWISGMELVTQTTETPHLICGVLPDYGVAWVDFLPRRVWHWAHNPRAVNEGRWDINILIHRIMKWQAKSVISQPASVLTFPPSEDNAFFTWRLQYLSA